MTESAEHTLSLPEIPDLSSIEESGAKASRFEDGWYEGTIQERRELTDRSGNDRIFESDDQPSKGGDSRNIRVQVELLRKSDGRKLGTNTMINYRPEDLSADVVAQVTAKMADVKGGAEWGSLFRPFMTLSRLSKLQKLAGVRQLQRNGNGGLDLQPLYGKKGYFRLAPDDRNPEFKAIVEIRAEAPPKAKVL
jgi:hypothetical protein